MSALLDVRRDDDRHTNDRLTSELIVWLGTVGPRGRPHNVPVWFAWDDPTVILFTMPGAAKAGHLRDRPRVTLALDSADGGQDIVIAEGTALLPEPGEDGLGSLEARFGDKYRNRLPGPFSEWRAIFSQPVLVEVDRVIAWTRSEAGVAYRSVP